MPCNIPYNLDNTTPFTKPLPVRKVMYALGEIAKSAGKEVPIRVGGFAPSQKKKYQGFFKARQAVIRIRSAYDLVAAAHEVGHALQSLTLGASTKSLTPVQIAELEGIGKALYGQKRPSNGYFSEGFAEFTMLYLYAPNTAKKDAPEFFKYFESTFSSRYPQVFAAIMSARKTFDRWKDQGAVLRAMSGVRTGTVRELISDPAELVRLARSRANKWKFKEKFIDVGAPLERLEEQVAKASGKTLAPSKSPFKLRTALASTHSAIVEYMVEKGMVNLRHEKVGRALRDATQMVGSKNREAFTIYLWAVRSLELHQQGRNPGLLLDDALYIKDFYENNSETASKFQRAASIVYDWNDGILQYMVDAGVISTKMYANIKSRNQFYIPLQRTFEELLEEYESLSTGKGRGRILGANPLRALKGSSRPIKDPFRVMIEQAERYVLAAHQRRVLDAVVNLAEEEGVGSLIEKIPRNAVATTVPAADALEKAIKALASQGMNVEFFDPNTGSKIKDEDAYDAIASVAISFFKLQEIPRGVSPVLPVWRDGKIEWYQVHIDLYNALMSMDIYRLPKVIDFLFGKPARMAKLGWTGLNASFSFVRNPIRDLATMLATSQSTAGPVKILGAWFKGYAQAFKGAVGGNVDDTALDYFERMGLKQAQSLGEDTARSRRAAAGLFHGRAVRTVLHPIDALRELFQIPESATRAAEFRLVSEKVGWDGTSPLTEDQAIEIAIATKRVTIDFPSAGEYMRVINQIVPFSNAKIQGIRTFGRNLKENRVRALIAGGSFFFISFLLWLKNRDDEWYKDLPWDEKYTYWYFKVDWPEPMLLRIPKPHEWGLTFSSFPEAILDSMQQENPRALEEFVSYGVASLNPGLNRIEDTWIPYPSAPVLNLMVEQAANRKAFGNRVITPEWMIEANVPKSERYTEFTSAAAKKIGEVFGVAPTQVDHAIDTMFGGLGREPARAIDYLTKVAGRSTTEKSDLPIVGTLFEPGGLTPYRSQSVTDFYDTLALAKQRQHSARGESKEERERRLLLEDAAKALTALFLVRRLSKSTDKKHQLNTEISRIARQAVDSYGSPAIKQNRPFFSQQLKRFEKEAKQYRKFFGVRQQQ